MSHRDVKKGCDRPSSLKRMSGHSLVELLIVLGALAILSAISVPYFFSHGDLYKSEDQALKVLDLFREAGQRALTQRTIVRVELDGNPTPPVLRMIDENGANPDVLIKTIPMYDLSEVRMDLPTGFTPPNPPNYPNVAFVSGQWVARFRTDGSVVTAADLPVSATLYSWPPSPANMAVPRSNQEVRAITIFGGSGAVRYWKYNGTAFVANR